MTATQLPILTESKSYKFHIRDWQTPFGEIIKGEIKTRFFLGRCCRGGIKFLSVRHPGTKGKRHLISEETIFFIEPANE